MQLSNFMELFTYWGKQKPPISRGTLAILDFVLSDPRFHLLFTTSLEFQKYIFVKELLALDKPSS
jgi:hypothetical protein